MLAGAGAVSAEPTQELHFLERVQPLLQRRCVSCHGPDKVTGGLRMDSRPALLRGGDSGPALVPGQPSQSLLLQAVLHTKADLEMPPKDRLSPTDVAVLERWIREGAPWFDSAPDSIGTNHLNSGLTDRIGDAWSDSRNPIVRLFGGQRLDLWSLRPIRRVSPPATPAGANPIDQFIGAKLAEHGLTFSPEADRRTLARRLTFDLTGLPPSPAEVDTFVRDHSPAAFEKLVERLLASPRYGEHQARLWLDVVRYSDSNGFDWDEYRKQAWRFRDYVIRAFNGDLPFNQFIQQQLAGDELLAGPPKNAAEQDALIATGYLRLGPHDNSAASFNEADRSRAELMTDLVETTGSAFLGLTLSCCRCHDHKTDPLSQADHFRMRAFFEPVKFADDLPLDLATEQEVIRQHNAAIDSESKPLEHERDLLLEGARNRLRQERISQLPDEQQALLRVADEKRSDAQKAEIEAINKRVEPPVKEVKAALATADAKRVGTLEKELSRLKAQRRDFTHGLMMTDAGGEPPVTRVLFQGSHKQPRDPVEPGFLSALDPNPTAILRSANANTTGRRLTLAEWIASPDNPLTARVWVNRVWQQHFGTGLVATPNDFGISGARPTHPELLDWLASEFVRRGWSVKQLHRWIVTSATYRQVSSLRNPTLSHDENGATRVREQPNSPAADNSLLSHQNLRRLSAEQLRDALLSTAGLLQNRPGGAPVWPELPVEVLQANPAFLDDNETKTKGWYSSPAAEQSVRSVFLVQKRTVRVPFLETFDLPENSVSCSRRTVSVVAPQALALLNSPLALEASRAFAQRVQLETEDSIPAQVSRAFRLALQRAPTPDERELCIAMVEQWSLVELCRALLNLNEFAYAD
ncbi:MAG TPA: DUF1553 domain-containing protein [Verrucomicrobiota bacterium]|nr:hypothetical protein [Verrucomicrobiales bacterium]HRI13210.1 DUF1553 domain-containing protein [Verrucomicrobiota bacterium]